MVINMELQYNQLSLFLDSINTAAKKSTDSIIQEADDFRTNALNKAIQQASEASWRYIKQESEKIKAHSNRKVSEANTALRRQVTMLRSQITDSVFAQAAERLTTFTQTDGYTSFLVDSAKKMAAALGDAPFVLLVKEEDIKHKDILLREIAAISAVEQDNSIKLGGCRAFCSTRSMELDDTLDTRLENQREWFYGVSGLAVKE